MNKVLTASLEDYLEIICNYEDYGVAIRAIDISKRLNISRASVTEALQKLEQKGFIIYDKTISLTEEGRLKAQEVVSKHNILQRFFEEVLQLDTEEAALNACKIEHVITQKALDKISEFVKNR